MTGGSSKRPVNPSTARIARRIIRRQLGLPSLFPFPRPYIKNGGGRKGKVAACRSPLPCSRLTYRVGLVPFSSDPATNHVVEARWKGEAFEAAKGREEGIRRGRRLGTSPGLLKTDHANIQKKKEEEKALKELRAKASQKGTFGGAGLKKSGKK
ncbi:uncharacterized protein [Elaeis guineensis]|uniref:uncharacterized protein n=1 Tax=Elaeis guineensis var. tenera TaxID=51953 RepID=UPI003C6DAD56